MTIFDFYILFWVLPFLIVLFLCLQYDKHTSNRKIEQIPRSDWKYIIFISIVWPLGALFMISACIVPLLKFLIKERYLTGKKEIK